MAWISLSVNQLKENVRVIQRDKQREDRNVKRITAMIERIWNESKKKKKKKWKLRPSQIENLPKRNTSYFVVDIIIAYHSMFHLIREGKKRTFNFAQADFMGIRFFPNFFHSFSNYFSEAKGDKKTTSSLYIV